MRALALTASAYRPVGVEPDGEPHLMAEVDVVLVYSTSSDESDREGEVVEVSEPAEPAAPDISRPVISEVALSARARDGDVDAFATLVWGHQAELVRMAYRMLDDRDLARSVVVDTLQGAWRQVNGQPGSVTFRVEMSRVVMRRCLQLLADRQRTSAAEAAPAAETGGDVDLATALMMLPDDHRAACVLKELHGLSTKDIAFAIRVPPSNVDRSVSQARHQLITCIGSRNF